MAAVTRLGLHGGARGPYGSFAGKSVVTGTKEYTDTFTRQGLSAQPRMPYGAFSGKQTTRRWAGLYSGLGPAGVPTGPYAFDSDNVTVELTGLFANANWGDLTVLRWQDPYSALGPAGVPTGRYSFDNTQVVEADGVSGTASTGSLTVNGAATAALTTTALTASIGSVDVGLGAETQALVGQEATGQVGTVTATAGTVESRSNVSDIGPLGVPIGTYTFPARDSISVTLDGTQGTVATGTLSTIGDVVESVSGVAGTASIGTLATNIAAEQRSNVSDLGPGGVPGATYTFAEPTAITVSLTGNEATGAVATFDGQSTVQQPDGSGGTGQVGDTGELSEVITPITGVAATGSTADVILPGTPTLTGVSGTVILGVMTAQTDADVSTGVNSQGVTATLGSLSPAADAVVSIGAVSGTASQGTITPVADEPTSVTVSVSGVSTDARIGVLALAGDVLPDVARLVTLTALFDTRISLSATFDADYEGIANFDWTLTMSGAFDQVDANATFDNVPLVGNLDNV